MVLLIQAFLFTVAGIVGARFLDDLHAPLWIQALAIALSLLLGLTVQLWIRSIAGLLVAAALVVVFLGVSFYVVRPIAEPLQVEASSQQTAETIESRRSRLYIEVTRYKALLGSAFEDLNLKKMMALHYSAQLQQAARRRLEPQTTMLQNEVAEAVKVSEASGAHFQKLLNDFSPVLAEVRLLINTQAVESAVVSIQRPPLYELQADDIDVSSQAAMARWVDAEALKLRALRAEYDDRFENLLREIQPSTP